MPFTLTQEEFVKLLKAQAKWTADLLTDEHWTYSDDGIDYVSAACRLFSNMVTNDREAFEKVLNTKSEIIDNYACDGICPEIFSLNAPALQEEDD